jgi:hypothetical protein
MLFERTAGSAGGAARGFYLSLSQFGRRQAFPGAIQPLSGDPAVVPAAGAGKHERASRARASPDAQTGTCGVYRAGIHPIHRYVRARCGDVAVRLGHAGSWQPRSVCRGGGRAVVHQPLAEARAGQRGGAPDSTFSCASSSSGARTVWSVRRCSRRDSCSGFTYLVAFGSQSAICGYSSNRPSTITWMTM